jgi:catechol 2,3-dioxygenase-like lactoylglutathione lyase family enzyme
MKLSHIRLLTNQFPEMFRFYRDAIGLRVRWGDENGVYADLDTGAGAVPPLLPLRHPGTLRP